jgi:hypothetical protein
VKDQERYPPVPHSCINCTFPGQNVTYDVQKDTVSRIRTCANEDWSLNPTP